MASTYVQITREEFEQWLTSLTPKGKEGWDRVQGRAGGYLSHLSEHVSVLINSSIGGNDAAMAKDKGTMSMKLVARKNYARVLNKKEVAKKFYRTTKWRTNLAKGIKAFRDVYLTGKDFYDHLAGVVDLVAYQNEWLDKLDAIPGSDKDTLLMKFRGLLEQGRTLSIGQEGFITKALATSRKAPSGRPQVSLGPPPELISKVQGLYDALGWTILKSFLDQLHGGRFLTDVQMETVDKAERAARTTRPAPLPSFAADPAIVQRLEALDKVLDNSFTRSLLDQARKQPLSPAQMSRVREMEEGVAKGRAMRAPSVPPQQVTMYLRLLEELEDDEASLRQQEQRSFMDKYELDDTLDRARKNRDELMAIITTMGRAAQGEDRNFLRQVYADLRGGEELNDDTYARLRRMVSPPARSARTNIHVRFVDIPYIA